MDEATAELLSRYLDGDLDAGQARLLEQRLAAEPALEAELAALRRLQLQVRSVADRMTPPAELDAPLRFPDRNRARSPASIPPAVRWLGLAAGVALAVTVALEVARKPSAPQLPAARVAPPPASTAMAPEPAAAAPITEPATAPRLEAATEVDAVRHAAPASPPAEAASGRLPPLGKKDLPAEVERPPAAAAGRAQPAPADLTAGAGAGRADHAAPPGPSKSVAAVTTAPERERAKAAVTDEAPALSGFAQRTATPEDAGGLHLELYADDGASLATLALPVGAVDAGSRLLVTVAAGVIVGVTPDASGTAANAALEELIGRRLTGLPDGRYLGVVVGNGPAP